MKIYEMPMCEKCKERAITRYLQIWLCGRCLEKVDNKMKLMQREMFLTE